jgi:hypothetical protein
MLYRAGQQRDDLLHSYTARTINDRDAVLTAATASVTIFDNNDDADASSCPCKASPAMQMLYSTCVFCVQVVAQACVGNCCCHS